MGNPIREDPLIARVIRVHFLIGSGFAGLDSLSVTATLLA